MSKSDDLRHITVLMGGRVRDRRCEIGLSEKSVADLLGISVGALKDAEAGKTRLEPEHIVALSPVLQVAPSWFFEGLLE